MKYKELMMRLTALGMSTTMLCFSPATALAMDTELGVEKQAEIEVSKRQDNGTAVADENGFVIENGVLTKYTGTAEKVVIPDGVTAIGDYAFYGYSDLAEIIIPNTVTSIGKQAFCSCSNLTNVKIPNSVTLIGWSAFSDCSSLTSIEIPNSITSIDYGTFNGCSNLTSVKLPDTITSISTIAFSGCSSLTSIEIPNGVTVIGDGAFLGCSSLTSIELPDSVTVIWYSAFSKCSSLTSVKLSNSITSIGDYAFSDCSSLTSIEIPNSVTSMGCNVFEDCSSLTSVTLSNTLSCIEYEMFVGCKNLTKIVIPESVTSIDEEAFGISNLTIYGYAGSYAQTYAQENEIPFVELKKEDKPQENPFNDVPSGEYYYNPVLWAVEKGITSGLSQNQFAPEQACTRGQVVTFLWRAMGKPEPKTTQNPFVDVPANEYYTKAVLWALENGITSGTDATHFAPEATVTRSQFVTFLHRAEGKPTYKTNNPFADVKKDYYYDAILWAYEKGITTGLNATTFGTEQSCTRGQVVTFLYRGLSEK